MIRHTTQTMARTRALLWMALVCLMFFISHPSQAEKWKEVRTQDEVMLLREGETNPDRMGQVFASRGKTTAVLVSVNLREAGTAACADLERYLPLACGCRVEISSDKRTAAEWMIILATVQSEELLGWLGIQVEPGSIAEQDCLIRSSSRFPNGRPGLVLVGGSGRGLLNGIYTLLEKSARAWWEPLRSRDIGASFRSSLTETELTQRKELRWEFGEVLWRPAVPDRVLFLDSNQLSKRAVDWASRNRLSHLVVSTPNSLPISEETTANLKPLVAYAQGLGLKVLFMNVTHRLPADKRLPASSSEAIAESTKLFLDLFQEFNLDGLAWHTASEGIELIKDQAYGRKNRPDWEAEYFNSYYSAVRGLKKDALLAMLMGWFYMNPASKLAKLLPPDTIAWVVPNTPIIDAARTDLDSYGRAFHRVWYWLYVRVSQDGIFPTLKLDYLEPYFREAIRRRHGLAPQGVLYGNNTANAMYFAQVARDGLISPQEFLKTFGERYYGHPEMAETLLAFQEALQNHRNWNDNIHTTGPRHSLTLKEVNLLDKTFDGALRTAKSTRCPLFRERSMVLAITALRCLWRGTIEPPTLPGKRARTWKRSRTGPDYLVHFRKMVADLDRIFKESSEEETQDLFAREFLKIKTSLK